MARAWGRGYALSLEGGQVEHAAEQQAGQGGGESLQAGAAEHLEQKVDHQPHEQGGEGGGGAPLKNLGPQAGGPADGPPV